MKIEMYKGRHGEIHFCEKGDPARIDATTGAEVPTGCEKIGEGEFKWDPSRLTHVLHMNFLRTSVPSA